MDNAPEGDKLSQIRQPHMEDCMMKLACLLSWGPGQTNFTMQLAKSP